MAQCAGRSYPLLQTIRSPLTLIPALADEEDTAWTFCPSIGAAYLFTIFFALTTCGHIAQASMYRKGYSWVIIVSALFQTINYIFRIVSIKNPNSTAPAVGWFVLILVRFPFAVEFEDIRQSQQAVDRTFVDQCICIHGDGTYGL